MPQMSPLMWVPLMIINISLFYMMISLVFFSQFKMYIIKYQNNLIKLSAKQTTKKWKYMY